MLLALESLVPIILLVALGAGLVRFGFISPEVRGGLDRFTYWVALPSLFIHQLAATDFAQLAAGRLILVLTLSVLAGVAVAALIAAVLRLSRESFGVFVQAGFRGNLAFVGLPLIVFALGDTERSGVLVAGALVALAALVPIANFLSVITLVTAKHGMSLRLIPTVLKELAKNPLIISALIGGLLGWLGVRLPVMIDRPLELLGQTAVALALVSVGGALIELKVKSRISLAMLASAVKLLAVPALTYAIAMVLALPADMTLIAMIFAACPAASASFIMTSQIGGDRALAASCVVFSTLFSIVPLMAVLAWLG
jgi:malate permease and related proteins